MFDGTGSAIFPHGSQRNLGIIALLNSSIGTLISSFLSPTLTFEVGQLSKYPYISDAHSKDRIESIVDSSIKQSKTDWDSQETSWDFKRNPLL